MNLRGTVVLVALGTALSLGDANAAPIVSPTNNARYFFGDDVPLRVSPGPDVTITNVVWLAQTNQWDEDPGTAISAATGLTSVWSNAPPGTFYLRARTTDNTGITTVTPDPVTIRVVPFNDDFTNRIVISGDDLRFRAVYAPATMEPGEPPGDSFYYWIPFGRVWFSWTAPFSGLLALSATNDLGSPQVLVFTGSSVSSLSGVRQDGAGTYLVDRGQTYHVGVGRFYPEGPAEVDLALRLYRISVNDLFADRITLSGTSVHTAGSNFVAAALEDGEPQHGYYGGGRSVWWTWTAPTSGLVSIDTDQSTFETSVGVYTGETPLWNLVEVAHDRVTDTINFYAPQGTTFHIAVDGYSGTMGVIDLRLELQSLEQADNDHFTNAAIISGYTVDVTGSNLAATREPGEPFLTYPFPYPAQRTVWYSWTAPVSGGVFINFEGTNAHYSGLAVWKGESLTTLTRLANTEQWGPGRAFFLAAAGVTYKIMVNSYHGGEFRFHLNLSPAPENDNFADAYGLNGFPASTLASNSYATYEPGEPSIFGGGGGSVWWRWTAPFNGTFTAEAKGLERWCMTKAFIGTSLTDLIPVSNPCCGIATFTATAGVTYYIGVDGNCGIFTLTLYGPPANDSFANRIVLTGKTNHVTSSNRGATGEPNEPNPDQYNPIHRSVWWTWTAPTSGLMRLSLNAPFSQPMPAVYTGNSLATLSLVASARLQYHLEFAAGQGIQYQIQIDTWGGEADDFSFWLFPVPQIHSIRRGTSGNFQIGVGAESPHVFYLQASSNLLHWQYIASGQATAPLTYLEDLHSTNHPMRFYRLSY